MDLLRLVLARLPINVIHQYIDEREKIYKLRAKVVNGFTSELVSRDYLKLCAFQGEFVDIFANQLCDLYRSRAAFVGDLDTFRRYRDGVPDLDIAFASGVPEIEYHAFRLLRYSTNPRSVIDVTLIPRKEVYRKSFMELVKTPQSRFIKDATVLGYMSYPDIIRDDRLSRNESVFLGFVKAIREFEHPDPFAVDFRIEYDLPRFLQPLVNTARQPINQKLIFEGYFYDYLERGGILNALSCVQPRLLMIYVENPQWSASVRALLLKADFLPELFGYIRDALNYMRITQSLVDRAKEMLRLEPKVSFPSEYRNYLLVITGQNVRTDFADDVFHRPLYSLMIAVAHPQLTMQILVAIDHNLIPSNIFYDLPNYFTVSMIRTDNVDQFPNYRHKLHMLFATGQFWRLRDLKTSDDLWKALGK